MKIKSLLLVMILISIFASMYSQSTFVREINLTAIDDIIGYNPSAILTCSDNSIVILGEVEYVFGLEGWIGSSGYIVKLDAQGNCLWQRGFEPFWNCGFIGVSVDAYDNVYFLSDQDIYGYSLCKTDANGTSQILGSGGNSSLHDVFKAVRLPNNEIIAVGVGHVSPNWNGYYAFMRLSASGSLLAYRQYPADTPGSGASAQDVELGSDGFPVALCRIADSYVSLVKFDWEGNILQRTDISSYTSNGYYPFSLTKSVDTGNMYVLSYTNPWYSISEYADSLFQDSMMIDIFTGPFTTWSNFNSLKYKSNKLFLTGYISETDSLGEQSSNYRVVCYNTDFTHAWTWTDQSGLWHESEYTDCIDFTVDGCVVVAAKRGNKLCVAKIRYDGFVPNHDPTAYSTNINLRVYPNPSYNTTTISYDLQKPTSCKIDIYNLKGQLVKRLFQGTKTLGSYDLVWDSDDEQGCKVSSGVYFCRYLSEGQTTIKKIVLYN